jgi:hypothetical protein
MLGAKKVSINSKRRMFSGRTYQQILVDLEVAIIMSEVCRTMQRSKPFLISLIYFRPVVQQMMQLQ